MHPGLNGEYAVVRFTAPADGTYQLSGRFYALDDNGSSTTTDVWILAQNLKAKAFSGQINYHGGSQAFSFTGKVFQLKTEKPWISRSATAPIKTLSMTPPAWQH